MTLADGLSDSPRKRRKESNQRTQQFLHTARLLDACNGGQKLLFLEHNWTVARALKVISRVGLLRQACPLDVTAVHGAFVAY